MKHLSSGLIALAAALAIAPVALADPIIGTLGIVGGNDQWNATELIFNNTAAVAGNATGSFATVLGISPITTPAKINTPAYHFNLPDMLIFTVGTNTATFTITGPIDITLDNNQFLAISGTGLLTLAGFDDTLAVFSLISTDSSHDYGNKGSSTFGFDVSTYGTSVTPEPTSLLLFGSGVLGLAGMLRRRMARRQI